MMPLLVDLSEAASSLHTTTEVVEGLVRSGALKAVHLAGDPEPKYRPEDLLELVEHAAQRDGDGS